MRSSVGPIPTRRETPSSSDGDTDAAERVVGEHVGQADDSGLAVDVLGVVALDHAGDGLGQAPPAGEHAADQGVVDAELAALGLDALLGRARLGVDLTRIAGVSVDEDELADVVQQRGHHQPVASLVAELAGEPVGGALGGDGVQAEALGHALPYGGALEEVERARLAGDRMDGAGRQHLDAFDGALDAAARACPRGGWRGAATVTASATSASTAATTSAVDGSPFSNRRRTRLRDSASIGKASSASNAAVSRRPWPSL